MKKCDKKYHGGKLEAFWNNINFDKATEVKAEDVRDYILHRIKEKLNIAQEDQYWSNGYVCYFCFFILVFFLY